MTFVGLVNLFLCSFLVSAVQIEHEAAGTICDYSYAIVGYSYAHPIPIALLYN